VDSIHLAQNEDQWWALMNMVMKIRVPWKADNSLTYATIRFSRTSLFGVKFSTGYKESIYGMIITRGRDVRAYVKVMRKTTWNIDDVSCYTGGVRERNIRNTKRNDHIVWLCGGSRLSVRKNIKTREGGF